MSKYILEIKDVYKEYKRGNIVSPALKNININLKFGEDLAVIGASGSGKTTLLNLIGCLDKPTKGKIIIDNKDTLVMNDGELSTFRNRTIGFIFQFFNLQDYLTAQENVMIPMLFAGTSQKIAKEKALELLNRVGLSARAGYFPKQLSGGEMQRVAIARSLGNSPKILLADEPTANLDRASATKVLEIFDEINSKGVSVIVITHDNNVSDRYKNKIHLNDGQITN